MGSRKSGNKRPVYVNGEYCESTTAGAIRAAQILGVEVKPWQMQRALRGANIGVDISEKPPVTRKPVPVAQARKSDGRPLLRFPFGERPLNRGLPRAWR